MKKTLFLAAALLALTLSSCKKDEMSFSQFTAGMEQASQQGTKLYLDDNLLVKWDGAETVYVANADNPNENNGFFSVTPSGDGTWATLTGPAVTATRYTAIYPSSNAMINRASTFTFYASQHSTDGSIDCPMYAESNDNTFQFKHLGGYLKIHLQQTGVSVHSIEVSTTDDTPLIGSYEISLDADGNPVLTRNSGWQGTANSVLLTCNQPQDISSGHDFYIYLPPSSSTGYELSLKIMNQNGATCVKTCSQRIVVNRAEIVNITVGNTLEFIPYGRLNGLFTVGEDGHQVYFSRANLVAFCMPETMGAGPLVDWDFHQHQYDMLGNRNSVSGICDLFGWSTAATPFGMSTSTSSSDYSGDFVDWGNNFAPYDYRTLDSTEWRYLITSRYNANKYAVGQIQLSDNSYANGCILLPDDWTLPTGCTFNYGYGTSPTDFTKNTYTLSQWSQMEAAGAVFLPANGQRTGSNSFTNNGVVGYYWSSTNRGDVRAVNFSFGGKTRTVSGEVAYRNLGKSVRLVMDAPTSASSK